MNNQIGFLTPEQFRVGKRPKKVNDISATLHKLPNFNPRLLRDSKVSPFVELDENGKESTEFADISEVLNRINLVSSNGSHCILLVGLAGAGKSTFFSERLAKEDYYRINRDELKTMDKCEREFEKHIKANPGKTVKIVIDNINNDVASRSLWLNHCKTHNLIPIAFHFNISPEHAIHNNTYRRLLNLMCPDSASLAVPDWIISNQAKTFVPPTRKEGFSLVFKVNFQPMFDDRGDREIELYYMYLNEK